MLKYLPSVGQHLLLRTLFGAEGRPESRIPSSSLLGTYKHTKYKKHCLQLATAIRGEQWF